MGEEAHGDQREVGLVGEVEGLEGEGGVGKVSDEAINIGVELTESKGIEVGEAGVEGEWGGGGGGKGGEEDNDGAAKVGDSEEALAHQGDRLEMSVMAKSAEDDHPALVRQLLPGCRQ